MGNTEWRNVTLRRELRRQAESVERLAKQLEQAEDFPTSTASEFCQLIKGTAQFLKGKISIAPSEKLAHLQGILIEIGQHLRYPERSRIEHTPWSMAQATEIFLQSQVGSDSCFIIRPQWDYNYGIRGEFLSNYRTKLSSLGDWCPIDEWNQILGTIAQKQFYTISFPRVERLNILMHVNWGHEVGHILASRWMSSNFNAIWKSEEREVEQRIRRELEKTILPTQDDLLRTLMVTQATAGYTRTTLELAISGLKELISDTVGAHFFGPAALASLTEFSVRFGLDVNPLQCGNYPPWRYRIRLVSQAIQEDLSGIDYPDQLRAYINALEAAKELGASFEDENAINADIRTLEAYGVIKRHWDTIRKGVLDQLPAESKHPYSLRSRMAVVKELVDRMNNGIPPNEYGMWPNVSAASVQDIWNASWAASYLFLRRPNWGSPDDYNHLFRLSLKGIESSFVHTNFGPGLPGVA
jgi:hypothetical protein